MKNSKVINNSSQEDENLFKTADVDFIIEIIDSGIGIR